ncbi:hypothetical protein AYO21_06350 [Fonsecaea monophora]|uniref:BZIP domain-containing protein n=1 Tax=Fonsecaea monophora TaxID=254056 RepID=A0A177F511_9EURO|nr:hypothetical protein AYO21_06350 [Fonsecaea monophora]KAH0831520.1 hypothetical protein FOPE_00483 [Fonsecaea pedrosoi]OAG39334.1 hypothetical protein AYO21_06350 [Fonsecaea monophora]
MANMHSKWKERLTEKQLERKRRLDRINQRNYRSQFKESEAELGYLRLLARSDQLEVLKKLMEENNRYKNQIAWQQSRLDAIVLMHGAHDRSDQATMSTSARTPPSSMLGGSPMRGTDNFPPPSDYSSPSATSVTTSKVLHEDVPWFMTRTSMFFQVAKDTGFQTKDIGDDISVNDFLESFMAWKIQHGYGNNNIQLLIDYSNYTFQSTVEEIDRTVRSKTLMQDIYAALVYGHPWPSPSSRATSDEDLLPNLSERSRHHRAAALCAFRGMYRFRDRFFSDIEFVAIFWTIYRYYLFLIFPTIENWSQFPRWQRPTKSQLLLQHSCFVDGIVWPELRDRLIVGFPKYDEERLIWALTRNMRINAHGLRPHQLLTLKSDMSDFEMEPSLKSIVCDPSSFTVLPAFRRSCPEFADLAISTAEEQCFAPYVGSDADSTPGHQPHDFPQEQPCNSGPLYPQVSPVMNNALQPKTQVVPENDHLAAAQLPDLGSTDPFFDFFSQELAPMADDHRMPMSPGGTLGGFRDLNFLDDMFDFDCATSLTDPTLRL